MKKIYLLIFIVFSASLEIEVEGQVNKYTFSSSTGTYTPITGGTVWVSGNQLATDTISPEIILPFVFDFNNRNYTAIRINSNGFLALGSPSPSLAGLVYSPLGNSASNTATLYEGAISPSGADLVNSTVPGVTAEIRYENLENEFVVEFKDVAGRYYSSSQQMNFQVRLQKATNKIVFTYGLFKAAGRQPLEVGLRGSMGDVNNRNTATGLGWLNSSRGTHALDAMLFDSSTAPAAGTTFTWTPPVYKNIPPVFHSLPFRENFDATWADYDNVEQLPNDSNWRTWPSRGMSAWRRHNTDAGFESNSGWVYSVNSFFTPIRSGGAARLVKYPIYFNAAPTPGTMDLHLNFSTPGNKQLQFDYFGPDLKDTLVIYLSTDGGASFERKGAFANSSNTSWVTKSILLGNSVSPTSIIRFIGYTGGAFDIGLDNVYILSENCGLVTGLATSNITTNSATLNWTAITGIASYDYEVRTNGYPGSGATGLTASGSTNGSSVPVAGLTPTSEYTFYVRPSGATCGFSFPATFNTLCSAVDLPLYEDFSAETAPFLNYCERTEDYTPSVGWRLSREYSVPGMSNNNNLSAPSHKGGWFFIRGVNLTAGVRYSISFRYFGYGSFIKVKVGTNQTAAGMTDSLMTVFARNENYYAEERTGFFTPVTSGVYYFGFENVYSASYSTSSVFIDDIIIQQTPPPPPCTTNVLPVNGSTISAQPIQLVWHKVNEASSYDVMVSDNGGSSYTFLQTVFDTTYLFSASQPDKTYHWYIIPKSGGIQAVNCSANATSFAVNINDDCNTAIRISNGGVFNGSTVSATPSLNIPSCTNIGTPIDVWYSFTAPYREFAFQVTGTNNFKPVVSVYQGSCGSLTQIICETSNYDSTNVYMYLRNLTPNATYYIRVYNGRTSTPGTFTITADVPVPLPVKITHFIGEQNGAINNLSWTTETEQNNKGFELQRADKGDNFKSISFINTKATNGNSTTNLKYEYNDLKPLQGNNYYRLRQIDKDGKSNFSPIVVVINNSTINAVTFSGIYPNPVNDRLNLIITSPKNDKLNLLITDLAGRLIKTQVVLVKNGNNAISVDVNKLSAGMYVIKAKCKDDGESAVGKFVKR